LKCSGLSFLVVSLNFIAHSLVFLSVIVPGKTVADVCRAIEVSQPNFHRWKQQNGGMQAEESKRLTQLEKEKRLKKQLAEAELERAMV
jgi:putative transposase